MGVCSVNDTKSMNYCLNETENKVFNRLGKIGQSHIYGFVIESMILKSIYE